MPQMIHLTVNGEPRAVPADPERSLLIVLREELGLTGAKYGCAVGACGACTVLADGEPVRACVTPLTGLADRAVTTIEGLAPREAPHPVQAALVAAGAAQCGYCTPGMVLAAAALLAADPDPEEARIIRALDGNICRCCAYPRILRGVRAAAGTKAAPRPPGPARPDEAAETREAERLPQAASIMGLRNPGAGSGQPGSVQASSVQASSVQPGSVQPESVQPGSVQPGPGQPGSVQPGSVVAPGDDAVAPRASAAAGPAAPWDLQAGEDRDYFSVLPDGLVCVLPPAPNGRQGPWPANGGVWIHVGADGSVTAFAGKVDVGQDNTTALAMLVAEELGVPLSSVRMVLGDTDICPFDIGTFGSRSMPDTGQALATAAAAARQALIALAATGMEVDPGELSAADGVVRDLSHPGGTPYRPGTPQTPMAQDPPAPADAASTAAVQDLSTPGGSTPRDPPHKRMPHPRQPLRLYCPGGTTPRDPPADLRGAAPCSM